MFDSFLFGLSLRLLIKIVDQRGCQRVALIKVGINARHTIMRQKLFNSRHQNLIVRNDLCQVLPLIFSRNRVVSARLVSHGYFFRLFKIVGHLLKLDSIFMLNHFPLVCLEFRVVPLGLHYYNVRLIFDLPNIVVQYFQHALDSLLSLLA